MAHLVANLREKKNALKGGEKVPGPRVDLGDRYVTSLPLYHVDAGIFCTQTCTSDPVLCKKCFIKGCRNI